MDMNMPVNVPVDDPNADTEWNDILRKHGVIPEKPPSPTPIIEEALRDAVQRAHDNRLEDKDLDELDALEDEEDEEFLNRYRQQRMDELSTIIKASIFNQVYPLQKPDYSRDVTEASQEAFIFVHLTSSLGTNTESALLAEIWRELAAKFGDVKFCEMRADLCIEGYPEKNTPTVLVYHKGNIVRQVVTLRELGGARTRTRDLQKVLIDVGAVNENDHRVVKENTRNQGQEELRPSAEEDDDDDDWD